MELKNNKNGGIVYLYLIITFFLWGSLYVVSKYALGAMPAPALVCCRALVGTLTLLFLARKQQKPKFTKEEKRAIFWIGLLGYFSTQLLVTIGISLSGASMAALVNSLTPVAVTVVAAIVLGEKIDAVKIACLVLAVVGTCVVALDGLQMGSLIGVLCVLLSLVTWAIASTLVRRLTKKHSALIVTLSGMAMSLVFHLPSAAISIAASKEALHITWTTVAAILYLGIAGTGLAQLSWSRCLQMKEASFCSMFYPLQAVFSALLGAVILGETFKPLFFVGLALIAADVVLICLHNNKLEKQALAEQETK